MHASECLERDDEARSCACALALQDPQAEIVKQGEVIVDIPPSVLAGLRNRYAAALLAERRINQVSE